MANKKNISCSRLSCRLKNSLGTRYNVVSVSSHSACYGYDKSVSPWYFQSSSKSLIGDPSEVMIFEGISQNRNHIEKVRMMPSLDCSNGFQNY